MNAANLMEQAYLLIADENGSTVPAIRERFGVPKSTAALWVRKGLERGLLTVHEQIRTVQGIPGHLPRIYKITDAGRKALGF